MRSTERFVIYTGLVVAIALGLGMRPPTANATGVQEEPPVIAVVDVLGVMEQMLGEAVYSVPRDAMLGQLSQGVMGAEAEFNALLQELQATDQMAPRWQELYQRTQQAQGQLQEVSGYANDEFNRFNAGQAAVAYALVIEAANAVGDRLSVDFIVASRLGVDIPDPQALAGITQEILARPMIRAGAERNLTDQVRQELGLPDPLTIVAPAPVGPEAPVEEVAPEGDTTPEAAPVEETPVEEAPADDSDGG